MNREEAYSLLKKVDFGEIDGYGDPNLDSYFLDNDYWEKIIDGNCYIVAGRKGTGKSAIYRMIEEQSIDKGAIVHNTDFGEFPFNRLLQLSDNDFMLPNQYQSIWRYMILQDFCKLIVRNHMIGDEQNAHFQEIEKFIDTCIGNTISDVYRDTLTHTKKTEEGLSPVYLNVTHGTESSIGYNFASCRSISELNQLLSETVINYLTTCSESRKIYIQFDRLDDNYNALQNMQEYLCAIASLLKFVYSFNQELRRKRIANAKVVVYLRRDILREISKIDAESARWVEFTYFIDWVIPNTHHYRNSSLYSLVNKRIHASLQSEDIDFDDIFDDETIGLKNRRHEIEPVFKYILDRSMHRPRDVVQFCKKIQSESLSSGELYYRTIKNAEREYSAWLVYEELQNELNPVIKDLDELYILLRELGRHSYPLSEFYTKTKLFCERHGGNPNPEELARLLYDAGVIQNINSNDGYTRRRNSFRNAGPLDKNMRVIPNLGVWRGISD